MKVNSNSKSSRVLAISAKPQFFKVDSGRDFLVTFDSSDNILTVFHGKNAEDVEFIFAEVLAKFSEKKKISELWKINFREIESFLRDENHLPAFDNDPSLIEDIFNQTKISLIGSSYKYHMKDLLPELEKDLFHWENLNLVAKNRWAQKLISPLSWELVMLEEGVLTVTKTPVMADSTALFLLLSTILGGAGKVLPMKVVAV